MFKVNVHGHFQMVRVGAAPVAFATRREAAVIAYLVLSRSHAASRRELAEALWPQQFSDSARTSLRTALHRLRKSFGAELPLIVEADSVQLRMDAIETDLDHAERLHRTYLLAPESAEAAKPLQEEWAIRKEELLEGWDFEWLQQYRDKARITANEVGSELAKLLEAANQSAEALQVWRQILDHVPHQAEALKHAFRLEYLLNGKSNAMVLAKETALRFRSEVGIDMPRELQKIVKDVRSGLIEPLAEPELVRKRSELLLLARLFESNLKQNQAEAMALLAKECTRPAAFAHPRAMMSLLMLALEQTEGASRDRIQVAAQASFLASWSAEFEAGHRWSDFVLNNTEPDDSLHGTVLSMKGFMYFEQRQAEPAEECLNRAIHVLEKAGREDDMLRALGRLAGVQWHQLKFGEAIAAYERIITATAHRTDEVAGSLQALGHGNLCYVYVVLCEWEKALEHGRKSLQFVSHQPMYAVVIPAPLGLALFNTGEQTQGLRELAKAISGSCREGMSRFNQISLDFAAVALARAGRPEAAACVIQANSDHRAVILHFRSPAERELIVNATSIDPENPVPPKSPNPLKGQSVSTLSEWVCDELERLASKLAS